MKELAKEEKKREEVISSHSEGLNYTKDCEKLSGVPQIYCENEDIFKKYSGSEEDIKEASSTELLQIANVISKLAKSA